MASIDSDTAQVREAPWKKDSHYLGSIWDSGSTRAVGGAQGTVQSGLCALRVNFVDIKSVECWTTVEEGDKNKRLYTVHSRKEGAAAGFIARKEIFQNGMPSHLEPNCIVTQNIRNGRRTKVKGRTLGRMLTGAEPALPSTTYGVKMIGPDPQRCRSVQIFVEANQRGSTNVSTGALQSEENKVQSGCMPLVGVEPTLPPREMIAEENRNPPKKFGEGSYECLCSWWASNVIHPDPQKRVTSMNAVDSFCGSSSFGVLGAAAGLNYHFDVVQNQDDWHDAAREQ
ncbi:hypothetical protein K438DRAFT_1781161 [Mycena galopus ATCC 62051]|nr:hypothetical protein K438DRAFT_1781161 [Mycena galopus ATCC 62051]